MAVTRSTPTPGESARTGSWRCRLVASQFARVLRRDPAPHQRRLTLILYPRRPPEMRQSLRHSRQRRPRENRNTLARTVAPRDHFHHHADPKIVTIGVNLPRWGRHPVVDTSATGWLSARRHQCPKWRHRETLSSFVPSVIRQQADIATSRISIRGSSVRITSGDVRCPAPAAGQGDAGTGKCPPGRR